MPDLRRMLHRLCTQLYFERVVVLGAERLPARGPTLDLALHRNGAVDGFVLDTVLREPTFMIAAQWTRGLAGLFFAGIAVVRDKDAGDHGSNAGAVQQCIEHLQRGGELAVFPEGTSTLGPLQLPFKKGAARILSAALARGPTPIAAIPLGLHYECARAWRSKVEVVVGEPVDVRLDPALAEDQRVAELHARITRALQNVGVQFADERDQARAQALAYAATLGTQRSYFRALKVLEAGVPGELARAWQEVEDALPGRRVLLHQGVPLVPTGPVVLYALLFLLTAPLALAAVLLNLPPVVAAAWAGHRLADDRNVIALWRLLVGVPVLLVWAPLVVVVALLGGGPWWAVGYVLLSWVGLRCVYRAKKLAVALHNAIFAGDLRPRLLAVHRLVLQAVPP